MLTMVKFVSTVFRIPPKLDIPDLELEPSLLKEARALCVRE